MSKHLRVLSPVFKSKGGKRTMSKYLKALSAAAAIIVILASCAPAPTQPASTPTKPAPTVTPSKPLNVVMTNEATSLDPYVEIVRTSLAITQNIIEPLVRNTAALTYIPWLAESWEAVQPTKWRIHLKRGVKFHNGEPFNADAVLYSAGLARNSVQVRSLFTFVTGVEKVDDYTVDILTDEPNATLPVTLAWVYVLPPKYHAEKGANFGTSPVGTGPYRFVQWTKGVDLQLERNPDYWGPKPAVAKIVFRWAPEASTREAMLETGEVDIAQNIPPALVDRLNASGRAHAETIKSARNLFFRINCYSGPTADVRVRKAINYAIDVDSIIKGLYQGRAYGRDKGLMILEGMVGYDKEGRVQPYTYDPTLAKKLLAEAGYPNGFSTKLWHTVNRYIYDKEAAEAIANQLAQVGIKVELIGMEAGTYFSKINSGKVEGIAMDSTAPMLMTALFTARFYLLSSDPKAYGANARTEEFIAQTQKEFDLDKQAKILQDFEAYVNNDWVPFVWLWRQQDIYGLKNSVNWKPRPDDVLGLETASWK